MKKILIAIVVILVIVFTFKTLSTPPKTKGVSQEEAELILFWGDGCPHCKIVDEYITSNKTDEKVKISYKEVYYNKTNQNLLQETVKKCPSIDSTQGIGVPLAFVKSDNTCLYGDTPIIDWLKTHL
ncbi:thioredoxin family protein [Candidatus Shapirobacteria bacterium]|nr:thioredoxin family protein [Candidatus Shapirobacteria bacterium]